VLDPYIVGGTLREISTLVTWDRSLPPDPGDRQASAKSRSRNRPPARPEIAQEEERSKLSREPHDEVVQTMVAMLLECGRIDPDALGDDTKERPASLRRQI
jgi:signal transduction histidine kinase